MACGTPIITSNANGLEEIAGSAGLLVNPRDPDEIARAVLQVLTDPQLAARLAAAGLERSRTFSWEACARRTLEILAEVNAAARPQAS
jgi:glycosyltransferase involved in cell wall biosynthesis